MAEKISDLSGEEREQRIAELKRRMQESAKRNRAAQGEETPDEPRPEETPSVAPAAASTELEPPESQTAVAEKTSAEPVAEVEVETPPPAKPKAAPARSPAAPSPNGSTPKPAQEPSESSKAEMNRREFLTYVWAGALGLLALEGGVLAFQYMYPRFRAGEFGGVFDIGPVTALPEPNASPQSWTDGKFWLVTTEEDEPKALYMVCTHLGCLYQWVESNSRFECPCHGSKFTHDGHYIEGPAPRSLDYFDTEIVEGSVIVDTGARNLGAPASESPANASLA